MSGGIAYVYDQDRAFTGRCNLELVELEELAEQDEAEVKELISEHVARTGSLVGRNLLASWEKGARERFVKVMPRDYKRVLAEQAAAAAASVGATPVEV
jgi:glutamate synthase domain-containing protein 3